MQIPSELITAIATAIVTSVATYSAVRADIHWIIKTLDDYGTRINNLENKRQIIRRYEKNA